MEDKNIDQLAAELDGHSITDDAGQIDEMVEQPTEDNSGPELEQPEETKEEGGQETVETDPDTVEDESGKRYVPQGRFEKVYGKMKEYERLLQSQQTINQPKGESKAQPLPKGIKAPDKADILELKMTLPQFDPRPDESGIPTNPDYSPELDRLAGDIYKANPGITPLMAARQALSFAKEIAKSSAVAKNEARIVKSLQADRGITTPNSVNRQPESDVNSMDDRELEAYLKKIGQW